MFCEICKSEINIEKSNIFYGHHVKKTHNMSSQEYYDRFFKKENESKCKICSKDTVFENVSKGYRKYCSRECQFKDDELRKIQQQTCLEKYGNKSPLGNKEIIQKSKETLKEKYGVEFISQNKEIKEKANGTFKEIYGKGTLGSKELRDKKNKTKLRTYGVETEFQLQEIRRQKKQKIREDKRKVVRDKLFRQINENLPDGYELIDFVPKQYYKVRCDKSHEFECFNFNLINNRRKREQEICPICNPQERFISQFEKEIGEFIGYNYDKEILTSSRSIISPYELDVYLPGLNLAFEFNGLYWHNELYRYKNYHKMKTELCEAKGIHLIHIYEDDWIYKKSIVQSRILNLLGKTPNKIMARKCEAREVSYQESKDFLNENHIQGNSVSKYRYGLYYEGELVSLMTFSNLRKNLGKDSKDGVFELNRFCNKLNVNVMGGSSKLLNWFLNHVKCEKIISYADRSWSQGNLYKKLGFEFVKNTEPNYKYIIQDKRFDRFNFRKDVLIEEGFDSNKSEHEIMFDRKIYRIYDSGSILFERSINISNKSL